MSFFMLPFLIAATQLIIPTNFVFLAILFTTIILLLELFSSYRTYPNILTWLCLSLLAYPITVFLIDAPVKTLLKATFIPHF